MKQIDWLNLNCLRYPNSSQFSPQRKVIFHEKVFSVESVYSSPNKEICECCKKVAYLLIYYLPFFLVGQATNQAQDQAITIPIIKHQALEHY